MLSTHRFSISSPWYKFKAVDAISWLLNSISAIHASLDFLGRFNSFVILTRIISSNETVFFNFSLIVSWKPVSWTALSSGSTKIPESIPLVYKKGFISFMGTPNFSKIWSRFKSRLTLKISSPKWSSKILPLKNKI